MSQTAYWPWPPDCLTCLPCPLALPPNVSRSGTRSPPCQRRRRTAAPARRAPRPNGPRPCTTARSDGSPDSLDAQGRVPGGQSLQPDRQRVLVGFRARLDGDRKHGSGIDQGSSTSGLDLSERVSPVSAWLSLPMAQMSPATTAGAGRWCFPSGKDRVPMRSSSSWSAWPPAAPGPRNPRRRMKNGPTHEPRRRADVPENTRTRLTLPT